MTIIKKIKIRYLRFLHRVAGRFPSSRLVAIALMKVKWRKVTLASLEEIPHETHFQVFGPGSSTIEQPQWIDENIIRRSRGYPPIFSKIVNNVITTPYSSALIKDDKVYLPKAVFDSRGRVTTDAADMFRIKNYLTIGRLGCTSTLINGILIGGAGAGNWYHYVIECISKAFLLENLPSSFDEFPLIVPDECRYSSSFSNLLEQFSGKRRVHFVQQGDLVFVKNLIILDDISIGPVNLRKGEWPRIDDYSQHNELLLEYISRLRSLYLKPKQSAANKVKIYLKRPNLRRPYNQDELITIARQYGFEAVSPETYELSEQAKIFSEASHIIGPSGAAWVGMIFSTKPFKGLSWLPKQYEQFCSYSSLAHLLGHQLSFIDAEYPEPVGSSEDVFTRNYRVDPDKFRNSLLRIL